MDKYIKKRKSKSAFKKMLTYFKDYCNHSGIHGLYYLAETRTWFERLWWLFFMITSAFCCGFMINSIFQKYVQYPVIVTFSKQYSPLRSIPFPAVTICPKVKISQTYFNITEAKATENPTPEDKIYLKYAALYCEDGIELGQDGDTIAAEEFYNFLNESQILSLFYCDYLGVSHTCNEIFYPILTEDGLCYTFNLMDREDMFQKDVYTYESLFKTKKTDDYDAEHGYTPDAKYDAYPYRGLLPGAQNSLEIWMELNISDIEYQCYDGHGGYKVSLHIPSKLPKVSQEYFTIPFDTVVSGFIIPEMITTSEAVKVFDPIKRNCYFQNEKQLKYFKIYTKANCETECLTNLTLSLCGCVGFYMPRFNNTPVCGPGKLLCMDGAYTTMNHINVNRPSDPFYCNCLLMCNDVKYNTEISQHNYNWKPILKNKFKIKDLEEYEKHYTVLKLFFKTDSIETKERQEVFGFTDLISSFGGLVGLFFGFSILSFVEFIYFFTVRIIGNIILKLQWNGEVIDS